jgi:hypothetical protein
VKALNIHSNHRGKKSSSLHMTTVCKCIMWGGGVIGKSRPSSVLYTFASGWCHKANLMLKTSFDFREYCCTDFRGLLKSPAFSVLPSAFAVWNRFWSVKMAHAPLLLLRSGGLGGRFQVGCMEFVFLHLHFLNWLAALVYSVQHRPWHPLKVYYPLKTQQECHFHAFTFAICISNC